MSGLENKEEEGALGIGEASADLFKKIQIFRPTLGNGYREIVFIFKLD